MANGSTVQPDLTSGKIAIFGPAEVGKTCLFLRYADDAFPSTYKSTIGVDYKEKTITLPNKANIKLHIWDTAGQERFRSISKVYIEGADLICMVYDVTQTISFENMQELITPDLQSPDMIKFIVGNKTDMEEERQVTFDEGKKFADEKGYEFREVSAANGQGVNDLFLSVAKVVYRKKNPGSLT